LSFSCRKNKVRPRLYQFQEEIFDDRKMPDVSKTPYNAHVLHENEFSTLWECAMKKSAWMRCVVPAILGCMLLSGCKKWSETETGPVTIVANKGGATLGYSNASAIKLVLDVVLLSRISTGMAGLIPMKTGDYPQMQGQEISLPE
jgi:hypothetical protein